MKVKNYYHSPLGEITILADEHALLGLWFVDQAYYGEPYALEAVTTGTNPIIEKTKLWLTEYFSGKHPDPAIIPIELKTTRFRKQVLTVLQTIPTGKTITYQEIANQIGKPKAVRAVGGAVGHNPISIIVPCHRVLGSNGKLTGYAGGINRKVKLLNLER